MIYTNRKRKVYKKKTDKKYKAKSVTALSVRKMVNNAIQRTSELKEYKYNIWDMPVGQVNDTLSGYWTYNLTPSSISQGTNNINRVGNKMLWQSFHLNIGLEEQSNASNADCTFQMYLVRDKKPLDNVYVTDDDSNPVEKMFMANPFIRDSGGAVAGVIDGSSPRNSTYMQRFEVLSKKTVFLPGDNFQNATQRNRILTMGHKFKQPLTMRWDSGVYVPSSAGEIFLVVFASAGNINSNTASTLQGFVPRTAFQSGYNFSMNGIDYLLDN